jgi:hypothetical protein
MPSISKAQQEAIGQLGSIGENKSLYSTVTLTIVEKIMAQYGAEFKQRIIDNLNGSQQNASGQLETSITPEVVSDASDTVLRLRLLDYFDFINKGVKGFRSSKNAPNSPYSFKNAGIPDSMRASLRAYIESGKAKISNVKTDKAYGIGYERKGKRLSETEVKVNTLGYLIKAFGIKGSEYFTKAFEQTFKDFETVLTEAVGRDIVLTLSGINLGKK